VSGTAELLLGVIAVAVAVMALMQVAAIVAGLRLARRVEQIAAELDTGIKPLLVNLTTLSGEAARAAHMATAQVERFDRLFAETAASVQQTLTVAQHYLRQPAREGMAILAGIRAALTALQGMREGARRRSAARSLQFDKEEESLFIG
jgi:hypothetical protein